MVDKKRAWLSGMRSADHSYDYFVQRLRRSCQGQLKEQLVEGASTYCLVLEHDVDLYHARTLCQEFGVFLAHHSLSRHLQETNVLWIDYHSGYAQGYQLESDVGLLIVEANVKLADIKKSLEQHSEWSLPFSFADDFQGSVSQWFEDNQAWHKSPFSDTGLLMVDAMSANGQVCSLGEFSQSSSSGLQGSWQRSWVTELFSLAAETNFMLLQQASLGYYRLEEWSNYQTARPNLAALLLSARRSLFWGQRFYLKLSKDHSKLTNLSYDEDSRFSHTEIQYFNDQVKTIMDPWGIFMNINTFNTT